MEERKENRITFHIKMNEHNNTDKRTWMQVPQFRFTFYDMNNHDAFTKVVSEAKLAISMGIYPSRTSVGSSGSYFIRPSKGDLYTAIFKPADEEPYADLNPRWSKWLHKHLSPCCFGRACLVPNTGYLSEAMASLIDRFFRLEMVPRTEIVYLAAPTFSYPPGEGKVIREKVGSLQLFVNGFTAFSECGQVIQTVARQNPVFAKQFHSELERLICLDYLCRNTDRTADNWLVKVVWVPKEVSGEKVIDGLFPDIPNLQQTHSPVIKIAAIDHGLSFPWRHPGGCRRYPWSWESLPECLLPFSSELRREMLITLDDPRKWHELSAHLCALYAGTDPSTLLYTNRMLSVLRGQMWNLREILKMPNSTPADLVSMPPRRVEPDNDHFWKRYGWRRDKHMYTEQTAMGERWWVKTERDGSIFCCRMF